MADRITEIRTLIDRADHAYYNTGAAIMEDAVYDALERELAALCPADERLSRVGAPAPAESVLTKREHAIPMGSQGKASNRDEFFAWVASVGGDSVFHANLKADGGSISLEYVNGSLFRAVTRGDGIVGEDITANLLKFRGLPTSGVQLSGVPFTGHVRAEMILSVASWKALDPEMTTNPRNFGNGISRRKDGSGADQLEAVAFRCYAGDGAEIGETEEAMEAALRSMGFQVSPSVVGHAEAVAAFFERIRSTRDTLPYWIDGVVVKLNDLSLQRALGVVSNCPRGQVAMKFPPDGKETVLRSVELSVGHTGKVVPTGKFDPVLIGGTTVSSALLCNWDEIRALNVAIGDTILVEKKGDIIPKIVSVVHRPDGRVEVPEPAACPVCGGALERRSTLAGDVGADIFCTNDDCEAKAIGKVSRWLTSLNILGIGDEVLAALNEQLGVRDAADLYLLHTKKDALANLVISGVRYGEKRAAKVIEAIEASRVLTIEQFFGSLGIDALGKRRVELIRQAVPGEMDEITAWLDGTLARIAERAGVPNVATRIVADLEKKTPLILKMLSSGVSIRAVAAASPLGGVPSVCITGSLSRPKSHYAALIKSKGWAWKDGVSKDLTYLAMADPASTSSKAEKARKLGVKCIGEAELLELLGAG